MATPTAKPVTLDGVRQAPGPPGEDPRDGFHLAGRAGCLADPAMSNLSAEGVPSKNALLLGRRTCEDLYAVRPNVPEDNRSSDFPSGPEEYVGSRGLTDPPSWENSALLNGAETVAGLKTGLDTRVPVSGSGDLIQTLTRRDLVDVFMVLIHPLVLAAAGLWVSRRRGAHLLAAGVLASCGGETSRAPSWGVSWVGDSL